MLNFIAVNPDGVSLNAPLAFGTLLWNVPNPAFVFIAPSGSPFSVPIPSGCAHLGRNLCSQGGALGGAIGIRLTNALDIVIGDH